MIKLIKSDLRLTLRHPIFIFGIFLTFAVNLFFLFSDRSGGSIMWVYTPFCAMFLLPLGMCVLTVFTCGTDLSSRTVNRKLAIGCTKKEIFYSHLISALAAAFFLTLPCFISITIPMYLAKLNFGVFFVYYVYSLIAIFTMTAITVFITLIFKIRILAFVLSFIICFSPVLIHINLASRVEAPEYLIEYDTVETTQIDEYGNMYTVQSYTGERKQVKNPKYITGTKRTVYSAIAYYSPGCFLYCISSKNLEYCELGFEDVREDFDKEFNSKMSAFFKSVPFSLCIFSLFTILGAEAFRRRELS